MKPLSGTFAFVALAVIAIVTVLSCQTHLSSVNRRPEKIIGDPDAHPRRYVEFKNGLNDLYHFNDVLKTLKRNGGDCQIYLLRRAGGREEFNYCDRIKTDKITKSKVTDSPAAGESAANDPHVTYRVASPSQADIDAVVDTLKPH
jgi:hypothetical protein